MLLGFTACEARDPQIELSLAEVRTVAIAAIVRGASIGDDGRIVAWNGQTVFVESATSGRLEQLTVDTESDVLGAYPTPGGVVNVLQETRASVHDTGLRELKVVPLSRVPQSSTAIPGGWRAGAFADAAGSRFCTWEVSIATGEHPLRCFEVEQRHDHTPNISSRNDKTILGYGGRDWLVYDVSGLPGRRTPIRSRPPGDSNPPFFATRALLLDDSTVLQTMADPTSDERRFLIFGIDGRRFRQKRVDAPMGFAGISPSGEFLIAIRDAGAPELVVYRRRRD